jgi:hypothetical protein
MSRMRRIALLVSLTCAAVTVPAAPASDASLRADVQHLVAASRKVDVQSVDSAIRFRTAARSIRDHVIGSRGTTSRGRRARFYAYQAAGAYVRWSDALIVVLESTAPGGSANDNARAKDQVRRYGAAAQQSLAEARRLLRA